MRENGVRNLGRGDEGGGNFWNVNKIILYKKVKVKSNWFMLNRKGITGRLRNTIVIGGEMLNFINNQ